jgi:methionyl aminopeptidase
MSGYVKKTKEDIRLMKKGGAILYTILKEIEKNAKPGVSTLDLDLIANDLCKSNNVKPAFLGYNNFPATICTGVDDVAVHGIPSKHEILQSGQILSVDMGIIHNRLYLDSAITIAIGDVDSMGLKLIEATKLALKNAISVAKIGNTVGDLGYAIESVAKIYGFEVIRQMTGHGVGYRLHEPPEILCYGKKNSGIRLGEGMTIAIEPMINEGSFEIVFERDGWTTRTADGKRSAIFEHTVLVGKKSGEIITIV